ncbi:MAG: hypothetical protein GY858_09560 [Candidatus Omnitrophica bacterium]|nr:hypothetical protein [Candidatus Omnitrophota bacterium]
MEKSLDNILNTNAKVKIVRFFTFYREDFMACGREISRAIKLSPPATHAALKELYEYSILNREIKGKLHLYRLNVKSRLVKTILMPAFRKEDSFLKDAISFITAAIRKHKISNKLASVMFYGSRHTKQATEKSDVDIAIVANNIKDLPLIEEIFIEKISYDFDEYFQVRLDPYIKTKKEFINRLKKRLSPVASLIKSYSVIYGEDPLDWI